MAQKYEIISALYERTLQEISTSQAAWQGFLRSACYNYKCRFDEQVLIYEQHPSATAVLEIERWNKQFGRWVNSGATGIAVFDRQADSRPRLKHYFDISDTHENPRFAKPVPLWRMQPQYEAEVIDALEASFGAETRADTLDGVMLQAVQSAVADNHHDYLQQLVIVTTGSYLEELDADSIEHYFKEALEISVSYMLLMRCGNTAKQYAEAVDFSSVMNFNTQETLSILGTATSDVAEVILREIARTVLSIQSREKEKIRTFANSNGVLYADATNKNTVQTERSVTHGTNIPNGKRLSPAQPVTAASGGSGHRQIREDAQAILRAAAQGDFHNSADERDATRAFSGNKPHSQGAHDTVDARDDASAGRDGGIESERPNALGGLSQQHPSSSGGNRAKRVDIQLTVNETAPHQTAQASPIEKADSNALSAFLQPKISNMDTKPLRKPQEQVSFFDAAFRVEQAEQSEQISLFRGFEISQQVVDEVLCLGSTDARSKKRICAYFSKDKTLVENIRFLKKEYKTGGEGFYSSGHKVSVFYDEKGIRIAEGEHTEGMSVTLLPWETVAKRTRELLELGRYLPQADIDAAPTLERSEISDMLLYTWRDIDESAEDLQLFATIDNIYRKPQGFPECSAEVAALLETPEGVEALIAEYTEFSDAYEIDNDILRFYFYKPKQEQLQRLLDLQCEPRIFTAAEQIAPPIERFITRDELDAVLLGHREHHDTRLAVYSFFVQTRDPKVRAKHLQKQQIYSGYSWGASGFVTKESKGLSISRGNISQPYAKLFLSWSMVQQRIMQLIAQDKYLSEADYVAMPQYEKHEIARQMYFAFDGVPQETPRPYPFGFEHNKAVPMLEQQLEDTERTEELEQLLLPVLDGTAPDDRYFAARKKAAEMLSEYRNGTFSLFSKRGKKPDLAVLLQPLTPTEEKAEAVKDLAARLMHIYGELGAPTGTAPTQDTLVHDLLATGKTAAHLQALHDCFSDIDPEEETAADIEMLLEDLQQLSESPQMNSAEITALFEDVPLEKTVPLAQENAQHIPLEERVRSALETVTDAKGYPALAADVKKLLRDKNGDGLVPIAAAVWLKQLVALSNVELKEYADEYEAGTLDTFPILQAQASASLGEDTPSPIPPPPKRNPRVLFTPLHPEIPKAQRHDFHITDSQLGAGTPTEKYNANLAAIRTLKHLEGENRLATQDEQAILSRYVGWGGLASSFEPTHNNYAALKSLLTETEYAAARESTLTAFYTPPVVIESIYRALSQMGFSKGNVLDPACGVGNFLGMLPEAMQDATLYGVELDSISGRMAQQLYPNSNIAVSGFEKVEMPDSFFDVAVGNVPFGDFKLFDKRYDKHKWLIHDYFFGKTLDKVRPGGVVAFVTSKGTMDKKNSAVRKYLAQRADLIGAIRLPSDTFKKNAGTEVTSDIIFLQKRDRMVDIEPEWVHLDTDENGIAMNSYFVQHPEMMLGEMAMVSGPFGMESTCKPYANADLAQLLDEAVQNLHAEIPEPAFEDISDTNEDLSIPADPSVRNFSYTVSDGKLYFRENSRMNPVSTTQTGENRMRGMIALRDCARHLIELQTEDYPEADICSAQANLNRLYDAYTKKYDILSSRGNEMAFGEDSSYPLLCSLEVLDENGKFKEKAAMFTRRTIKPHVPVTSVDTASEALAVSISEKAYVDMEYMAQLSGKSEEEVESDLTGVIFRNVHCATDPTAIPKAFVQKTHFPLITADEYLSGNVREKLAMARALYEVLPAAEKQWLVPNVTALEAVQPVDLTAGEISVRIGATWIPPEIYRQFMLELFGTSANGVKKIEILYTKCTGEWHITNKNADHGNVKIFSTYGTLRASAYHILEQTLNLKDVRIFDTKLVDGKEVRLFNKEETQVAQDRQDIIKSAFSQWLWKDIDRREAMCAQYNEIFNSIRPREYDGRHINFVGMNPEITLEPHQINAVARALYGGNTLLAHCVGAGKTFEMVAIAMESKRLGLCAKSLFTVPNHIIGQFAAEWLQLYPSANLLVATKKDFEAKNRKKFCARISTGEYDAVIIGHSQSERIPMSPQRQESILQQQINDISHGINEARGADCPRYTIKQMERTMKGLQTRIDELNDQSRKDNVVCFEELGVDRLFVDESHNFKNLFLVSKMRNVGGVAQTDAKKSSDLFMKCRYLDELTGGKGIVFATGTPISNSMVELFTIQRYLQYEQLEQMDLTQFDAWASTFGETVAEMELAPEGTGFRMKTRFSNFYNLPELMSVFKECADIQTADMLKLPVPKANFHTEVIKPSDLQKQMVAACAARAEEVRSGSVDPRMDNMLKITNDGRKIALDVRLFNPLAPDEENGKVSICARNVFRIWQDTTEQRGAQLVFCDMSTPSQSRPIEMQETTDGVFEIIPDQFLNVYDDLKRKLMAKGIPEHEIKFIHEANTEAKKLALFGNVRSGAVRVLVGSTPKMGAGTNVQKKLVALHDLDCPWRPSDLEQRLGRIVRQKNDNPEVDIFRYVTEGTFDAYMYQLVEKKQRFIAQIMTSKTPVRIAADVDGSALSYAEIKALATGNPMIIEKCNLDAEVSKLNTLKSHYLNQKYNLESLFLRKYPAEIAELSQRAEGYTADMDLLAAHPKLPNIFPTMEILGNIHTEKETAGNAILEACTHMTGPDAIYLGTYRGFAMSLCYVSNDNQYRLSLKGTLSHSVVLGADTLGNLTRIENVLDGFSEKLENVRLQLTDTKAQLANVQIELEKPFAKEEELMQKSTRLREITTLLKLDEKDHSAVDIEPDENESQAPQRREQER